MITISRSDPMGPGKILTAPGVVTRRTRQAVLAAIRSECKVWTLGLRNQLADGSIGTAPQSSTVAARVIGRQPCGGGVAIGSHDPAPDRTVLSPTRGFLASTAIGVVARLGIADRIVQQPRTAPELADLTGVDANGLRRALRFLTGAGIFYEDGSGRYRLTAAAGGYSPGVPRYLCDAVVFLIEPMFWRAAGNFSASLQRGSSITLDEIFGVPQWEHLSAQPDAAAIFDAGMVSYPAPQDDAPTEEEGSGIGAVNELRMIRCRDDRW